VVPSHFTQAVAANTVLGIAVAVVVFGAAIVPATMGGVTAGILIYAAHRVPRRPRRRARRE
jgi:hypothetical protein